MAENTQMPWQASCTSCENLPGLQQVWTGMTKEDASAGVIEHIGREHDDVAAVRAWRNPGVQWCD